MVNIKNTLDELKDILNTIKAKQDANTAWTGTEKADIEKRLNHVLDKSKPRHTNLSTDLDTDLKDIENIDQAIGQEKLKTDAEIKKLTDEKKQLQSDITAKEALIKQKNEEIGDKLTADLITKLDSLSKGVDKDGKVKIDDAKLTEIKTLAEELKTKGISTDFSKLDSKFNEVKEEVKKIPGGEKKPDYWSIGAAIGTGISVLLLGYVAFLKPSSTTKYISSSKNDDDNE